VELATSGGFVKETPTTVAKAILPEEPGSSRHADIERTADGAVRAMGIRLREAGQQLAELGRQLQDGGPPCPDPEDPAGTDGE
jgi:hypothetical protein